MGWLECELYDSKTNLLAINNADLQQKAFDLKAFFISLHL